MRQFHITKEKSCDVIVAGGGCAGVSAAVAAARHGAKVMLLEASGVLGGAMTNGIVTPLSSTASRDRKPFGGLIDEIIAETRQLAKAYAANEENMADTLCAPHIIKYVLLKLCADAGVEILFHTTLLDADAADGSITAVYAATKSGIVRITAAQFIDATGDGDLAMMAGEEMVLGSEPDVYQKLYGTGLETRHFDESKADAISGMAHEAGLMQPVSIFFVMGGVEYARAAALNNKKLTYEDLGIPREEFAKLPYAGTPGFEENGDLVPLPQGRVLVSRGVRQDMAVINMTRLVGINGADADSLNRGELLTQLQLMAVVDLLKRYIPGFEKAYLMDSGCTLGIRETRRLVGEYVLSASEVIHCTRFEDAIARGSYIIDIHDPKGKNAAIGGEIKGMFYEIPYRSLKAVKNKNLHACGRCISVDHIAHSSTRIQGTCILTGQAAGTAAAMAMAGAVDANALRAALIADGVRLD